jgi:hypothetical protein
VFLIGANPPGVRRRIEHGGASKGSLNAATPQNVNPNEWRRRMTLWPRMKSTAAILSGFVSLGVACALALSVLGCDDDGTGPDGPSGRPIYGVDTDNELVVFGAMRPDEV